MTAAGICGDRQHDIIFTGANVCARGDIYIFLFSHGIGGMVALVGVVRVKKNGVHGLVAVKVCNPKGLSFFKRCIQPSPAATVWVNTASWVSRGLCVSGMVIVSSFQILQMILFCINKASLIFGAECAAGIIQTCRGAIHDG